MKKDLTWFFKTYFLWIIYFTFARLFFSIYEHSLSAQYGIGTLMQSFLWGLRHDFSESGYIMVLFAVLMILYKLTRFSSICTIHQGINTFFLFVSTTVMVVDAELYKHWGSHLDTTPLMYLFTPKEMMASASIVQVVLMFIVIAVYSLVWRVIFKKIIFNHYPQNTHPFNALMYLILGGLMIIPIRGGFGIAPLNTGSVYFHKDQYPNHLAVNANWNFLYSLSKINTFKKPYGFMSSEEAETIVKKMTQKYDDTPCYLKTRRPNVVIILLESFTGKMIGALGSNPDYTPHLSALTHKGIFFNHIHSTSDRSDKGIVAVTAGFPAQPTSSIMKYPQKSQQLPFITKALAKEGYSSCYYYGGDTHFANMNSLLINAGFQRIVDMFQFDKSNYNSKWGVHDHVMFERLKTDIDSAKAPFFKMFFTLSSHEPFEVPMETVIQGDDETSMFLNSVAYTDKCIGDFFDYAERQPWWDNTLFVLVADHGHPQPGNTPADDNRKYKIPLLMVGGALNVQDTVITTYGSNTDVGATILGQMGLDNQQFIFAKDLLNPKTQSFSFFDFNGGFGYLTDSTEYIYNLVNNKPIHNSSNKKAIKESEAYLEALWNDFLRK